MTHSFHALRQFAFCIPLYLVTTLCMAAGPDQGASPADADSLPQSVLDQVFTLDEAARYLRAPLAEVERMAINGSLPGRRIGASWRFSKLAIVQWLNHDRPLKIAVALAKAPRATPTASIGRVRTTEIAEASGHPSNPNDADGKSPQQPIGERPTARTAEEVALRDSAVLLRAGQSTAELGVSYSRADKTFLPTLRTEQNTTTASLSLRHGLRDNLQLSASLPYRYQRTAAFSPEPTSDHSSRFGDLSLGLLGVAFHEASGRPTLIWNISAIAPTGPGDAAIGAGLSVTKSLDPVVLFAGANYLHGLRTDVNDPFRSLAKHNLSFNAGYAFAVNDSVAFSGQLIGSYRTHEPTRSGVRLPREQYQLQLGLTYLVASGLYVEPTVAFGLGTSTPDFSLGISIPYNF